MHWDHATFAQELHSSKVSKDYKRVKALLSTVAEDNYWRREHFGRIPRTIPASYHEAGEKFRPRSVPLPVISFSRMDTADALLALGRQRGRKVCALNFANGKDAGGGYKNGASAQEEDLCRRIPLLYSSLLGAKKEGLYPFGPPTCPSTGQPEKFRDVLYTTNLVVGRASQEEGYRILHRDEQATVSLVAAAAPNLKFGSDVNDAQLIYQTMVNIFRAPQVWEPGINTLILGAWGCGAFGGDPSRIADLFLQALLKDGCGQGYEEVHFAIPQFTPEDPNYAAGFTSQENGIHSVHNEPKRVASRHSFLSTTCPDEESLAAGISFPPNRLLHDQHVLHMDQLLEDPQRFCINDSATLQLASMINRGNCSKLVLLLPVARTWKRVLLFLLAVLLCCSARELKPRPTRN
ncbi:unnamed protein product [Symbiodinium sp. CCMP2592]|nr:unnamed protein product [Symbiodinium sp. CCMP2592]